MIDKVKLGYSPLSKKIYIYRHGKKENVALEKREVDEEVMRALTEQMLDGYPKGAAFDYHFGDKEYTMIIKPIKRK